LKALRDCIIVLIQFGLRPSWDGLMDLHISQHDGTPIYLQVIKQVKILIAAGRLEPGEEMPPIRVLAKQLLINPNTVARAYRDLEAGGWVTKRKGAGTYVSGEGSPLAKGRLNKILRERITDLLTEAHHMKIPLGELIEMIEEEAAIMAAQGATENE